MTELDRQIPADCRLDRDEVKFEVDSAPLKNTLLRLKCEELAKLKVQRGENASAGIQRDRELRARSLIKRMDRAAEAVAEALGLPSEAKYDVMQVMYGTEGQEDLSVFAPIKAKRWPTVDELRAVAKTQEDPRETLRKMRARMPHSNPKTAGIKIK